MKCKPKMYPLASLKKDNVKASRSDYDKFFQKDPWKNMLVSCIEV